MMPIGRRGWLLGMAASSLAPRLATAQLRPPVRLSLNENAFGPSPKVRVAILAELDRLHRYVEEDEADALIRQIAKLERIDPAQIVLGDVLARLGLHLGARVKGGEVVYSVPGYTELPDAAAALGVVGRGVPLSRTLANDLPALAAAVNARTIAVSLVNPHNPSGAVSEPVALDAFIAGIARRTLVIVDEAYLEYDSDFAGRTAVRHVRDGANVLVFRTLAKIYGLAGLPFGYSVAPVALATELRTAGIGAPHTLDRLSLAAARAALADQAHVGQVRDATARERDRLHQALDRLGWQRSDSHGDFVFFLPSDPDTLRARFAAAGIAIGKPFPPLERWLRVTIGTRAENDRLLAVLTGRGTT